MRRPTIRQIYALAAALCAKVDEPWPETFDNASELIERLRIESGHPAPRLEDLPPPRVRRRGRRGADKLARRIAAEVAHELR